MVSPAAAYLRLKKLAAFRNLTETDFRPIVYVQAHASLASGASSVAVGQSFPGGAIILGITSAAYIAAAAATAQPNVRRQFYGLNFSFTNNETLTPGGPVNAEALLGGGDDTMFPVRELVVAPNQAITSQVVNYSTSTIVVHIAYHCLVYRMAT